jgi:hypothetical protein
MQHLSVMVNVTCTRFAVFYYGKKKARDLYFTRSKNCSPSGGDGGQAWLLLFACLHYSDLKLIYPLLLSMPVGFFRPLTGGILLVLDSCSYTDSLSVYL